MRKVLSPVGKGTVTQKEVAKVIREMEELALSLGVDKDTLWDAHAETFGECWDCGVSLSDSKVRSDPTCPACGKVWTMS